jgi:hypothetical protein
MICRQKNQQMHAIGYLSTTKVGAKSKCKDRGTRVSATKFNIYVNMIKICHYFISLIMIFTEPNITQERRNLLSTKFTKKSGALIHP